MDPTHQDKVPRFPKCDTHVSEVEGDLQVLTEGLLELGVHFQHVQKVVPVYLVQITVS